MLWWILGGIALVFLLLCLTPLGMLVTFGGEQATADLTIGPFKIRLAPAEASEEKHPKKEKKKAQKKREKSVADRVKTIPKPTLEDVKSAVRTLAPACKKALRRTRRGIRIHPLRLSVTIGGAEDAAWAAETYGYAHAAVWTVMPVLEELLVIPDPRIHLGLDFETPRTYAEGELGISIRVGTLLALGLDLGIPALNWFLRYQKQKKQQPPVPASAEQAAA